MRSYCINKHVATELDPEFPHFLKLTSLKHLPAFEVFNST